MSHEELEKRVRSSGSLSERLDKCREMIAGMCKERRPPKMSIPVQWDDEDFFINTTIKDALEFEDLLVSARAIAERKGKDTAWERFSERLRQVGIGSVTAKVFKVLPSD